MSGLRLSLAACLLGLSSFVTPLPALAQPRPTPPKAAPQQPAEPAPAESDGPAYEPQLLALAEIIGSLAYLRTLCGASDAEAWRDRMTALADAEGRTPQRRNRLTSAYNRGFKAYALTHRICTDASQEAASRLAGEGERLSKALAGRYGG